jgi:hypothetical protein
MTDPSKLFVAIIAITLWLTGIILVIQSLQEHDIVKAVAGLAFITATVGRSGK